MGEDQVRKFQPVIPQTLAANGWDGNWSGSRRKVGGLYSRNTVLEENCTVEGLGDYKVVQ